MGSDVYKISEGFLCLIQAIHSINSNSHQSVGTFQTNFSIDKNSKQSSLYHYILSIAFYRSLCSEGELLNRPDTSRITNHAASANSKPFYPFILPHRTTPFRQGTFERIAWYLPFAAVGKREQLFIRFSLNVTRPIILFIYYFYQ